MPRLALLALGAVLALLLALSLRGGDAPAPVASELVLRDVRVTLHPQADPDAVWTFAAPEVRHDPRSDTTTLLRVDDGARVVDGETDFTIASDRLVIDARDDLRGDAITAVVLPEEGQEGDTRLDMTGVGDRQVLIDQAAGRFSVPHLELSGEGYESVLENVSVAFDLQDFQAGGPGTIGVGRFEVAAGGEDPE